MRWFQVAKDPDRAPPEGRYPDWRQQLAEEANFQCVYCAVSEPQFGGARGFHIEHYRPKSRFEALTHDYSNLFYACCVCNVFKGDDWPRDPPPALDLPSYPSPAETDYNHHFEVDWQAGRISAKNTAAAYVLQRLHLNRPQLMNERRNWAIVSRLRHFFEWVESTDLGSLPRDDATHALLLEFVEILGRVGRAREQYLNARPYEPGDLRNE